MLRLLRGLARRLFLGLILTGLVLAGCAPGASGPVQIAVLLSDDVRMPKVEGLKAGLADLGYGEERIDLTVYSARGDRTLLPDLAAKALVDGAKLVVAGGGIEAVTMQRIQNLSVPVVMMGAASTVRSGLVASYARPGGMLTGLDNQHAELSGKRLELLTKLVPNLQRVLLIYDPTVIPGVHGLEVTEAAAKRLGLAVVPLKVENMAQALSGLSRIQPGDFDAALLLPAFVLESGGRLIAGELTRLNLPAMGPLDLGGEAGVLAAYGNSMFAQGRQSARFVAKILQGEQPANIPVETPDNPELVVDLVVARKMGLELLPEGMAFAQVRDEGRMAP